jgi:predicted nuclease of restriction endonuclease-like (RecB) superfamily
MLYGCTAISRKLEELAIKDLEAVAQEDLMASDLVFRDPYLLDFLGLKDTSSERDWESATLWGLISSMLDLDSDFGFVARQKRMTISDQSASKSDRLKLAA